MFSLLFVLLVSITVSTSDFQSIRTRYACTNGFQAVGSKCYHFSDKEAMWQDSHYHCQKTGNSTLAVIRSSRELNLLRSHMSLSVPDSYERWIDGIFDWKQKKWKWGSSGEFITFNQFSRKRRSDKFQWHCIVTDPAKQNRWNARKCTDKKRFICETEANTIIQFKLYDKSKLKRNFNIAKCTSGETLNKYQKGRCLKLLGSVGNNEPAPYMLKPKHGKLSRDADGYICPPHMVNLGPRCYTFSERAASWWDAYNECKKNKTKLAIVRNKSQDHNLRMFLNNFIEKQDRWIGGRYEKKTNQSNAQWKWAESGQPLRYKGFAQNVFGNRTQDSLEWSTIFMDPTLHNQWNAASMLEKKHFICQVTAKVVKKFNSARLKPPQATITILDPKKT